MLETGIYAYEHMLHGANGCCYLFRRCSPLNRHQLRVNPSRCLTPGEIYIVYNRPNCYWQATSWLQNSGKGFAKLDETRHIA